MKHDMKSLSLLLGAVLLLCFSCVREVVMDADEKPMVVVECVISNNPVQALHLRYTKGAAKKDYEVVTEAEAVLLDLTDGSEAGRFVKVEDGVWTLDYEAIDEHEYRLEVSVPGYDLITAEQRMPVRPDAVARRLCFQGHKYQQTEYEFCNGCAYGVRDTVNSSLWVYAMNYNSQTGRREMAEYICCDGRCDDFNLTDSVYSPQIDTIFFAHNTSGQTTYVEVAVCGPLNGTRMHRKYLRFAGGHFSASIIAGTFEGFYPIDSIHDSDDVRYITNHGVIEEPADDQGYLVFASLSEEYETYHMDYFRFKELEQSSKLSDIYLRDNVFTNINGGLGIFGAKAETKMVWSPEKFWFKYFIIES